MSVVNVAEVFQGPALAPGVTIASVAVSITDASGAVQTATLNGTETPTPWAMNFTIAAGAGSVTSTSTDSTGAVGTPVNQTFNTGTTGIALALSGTTVSIVTP